MADHQLEGKTLAFQGLDGETGGFGWKNVHTGRGGARRGFSTKTAALSGAERGVRRSAMKRLGVHSGEVKAGDVKNFDLKMKIAPPSHKSVSKGHRLWHSHRAWATLPVG
jgi:hypothetical protein